MLLVWYSCVEHGQHRSFLGVRWKRATSGALQAAVFEAPLVEAVDATNVSAGGTATEQLGGLLVASVTLRGCHDAGRPRKTSLSGIESAILELGHLCYAGVCG